MRPGRRSASNSTTGNAWTTSSPSAATPCWRWLSTPLAYSSKTTTNTGNRGRALPHFPKPAVGSWTENYPELGTAPVDYSDSIDPAFFEAEREAIFKRPWLNVGRGERLPRTGSYFTKELPSAGPGMSVIVVKTKDGSVKAFHNVCRHRGNKLVWNDFPHRETSGTCRQFTCKYHACRYSLDGDLTFIQQEGEFFNVDKSDYGLVPVRCELWEGFIFVNPDNQAKPLVDYLGALAKG